MKIWISQLGCLLGIIFVSRVHAFDSLTTLECSQSKKAVKVQIFDNISNGKPRIGAVFALVYTAEKAAYILADKEFTAMISGPQSRFEDKKNKITYGPCRDQGTLGLMSDRPL